MSKLTETELQERIVTMAALARETDVESLVRRAELGNPMTPPTTLSGYLTEDIRILAVGVARLRGMAEIVAQNQAKRRP